MKYSQKIVQSVDYLGIQSILILFHLILLTFIICFDLLLSRRFTANNQTFQAWCNIRLKSMRPFPSSKFGILKILVWGKDTDGFCNKCLWGRAERIYVAPSYTRTHTHTVSKERHLYWSNRWLHDGFMLLHSPYQQGLVIYGFITCRPYNACTQYNVWLWWWLFYPTAKKA